MEGEFDRETKDDGWAPVTGTWKPLDEQLNNIMTVATLVMTGKKKEKK